MDNSSGTAQYTTDCSYTVRSARLRSSVPLLEPGTPRFLVVCKNRINHTRVATNTRPTECPTQPRRMIDASRVYTFILTTKCIQSWASFRAISCAKNRTRADPTSLNTSNGNSIRSSARTGDTCFLLKQDAEKWKNPGVSMAPLQQPIRT